MSRTTTGRYIYAVGGNAEAARLSGIRVSWVLFFVYTLCGVLAGLGGIVMASQLKSGAPTLYLGNKMLLLARTGMKLTPTSGGKACFVDQFSRSVTWIAKRRTVSEANKLNSFPLRVHQPELTRLASCVPYLLPQVSSGGYYAQVEFLRWG